MPILVSYIWNLKNFISWNLGGQANYRKLYIEKPGRFFLETSIIVFVIDMQDELRYHEAMNYLMDILNTLEFLKESPFFIILCHKSDPELVNTSIFQEKLDYIIKKVSDVFKLFDFQYELQTSSIYNTVSMTPSFSILLKKLFSTKTEEDPKIQMVGDLIAKVFEIATKMGKQITKELSELKLRIMALESNQERSKESTITTNEKPPVKKQAPFKPSPPHEPNFSPRTALMKELKQVFGVLNRTESVLNKTDKAIEKLKEKSY